MKYALHIRALAVLAVFSLLASPALFAKDKKKKSAEAETVQTEVAASTEAAITLKRSTDLDLETSLDWANATASGSNDAVASSGGPTLKLNLQSGWDLRFRDSPALRTGGFVSGYAKVTSNAKSPSSNEPYLVLDGVTLESTAGWYIGADLGSGGLKLKTSASLEGGLRILDLADSDYDYQPVSASGEAYWFRVLPICASTQKTELSFGKGVSLSFRNRLLFWRETEDAYGEGGNGGYEDKLKADLSYRLSRSKNLEWNAGLAASASFESGLVVPKQAADLSIRTGFESKRVGALKLSLIGFEYEAEQPDASVATDTRLELLSGIEFSPDLKQGSWKLSLAWPWAAWDGDGNSDATLAQWHFTFGAKLRD